MNVFIFVAKYYKAIGGKCVMKQERKITRWDRRRSNKRLKRLQKTEEYQGSVSSLDSVNIRLPELKEQQKDKIKDDLIKKDK
jgi:hypothetical protein